MWCWLVASVPVIVILLLYCCIKCYLQSPFGCDNASTKSAISNAATNVLNDPFAIAVAGISSYPQSVCSTSNNTSAVVENPFLRAILRTSSTSSLLGFGWRVKILRCVQVNSYSVRKGKRKEYNRWVDDCICEKWRETYPLVLIPFVNNMNRNNYQRKTFVFWYVP